MKIVILAGGGGTRLWPLSRENKPKQFSQLIGNKTMFEETVNRFRVDFGIENIYVSLNKNLVPLARSLVPDILENNYIIEPEKRDTAPAMGLIAAKLFCLAPDEPVAYIPSDHYIGDTKKFISLIKKAEKIIKNTGKMLDIAVWPSFPSSALGYTKIGNKIESTDGFELYEFLGHTEKPEFEVAKKYLEKGNYLWHANYYMWTPRKILQAFEKYSPTHYLYLDQIVEAYKKNDLNKVDWAFGQMVKTSFDYAITEKIDNSEVLIIKGDFNWSDVGTFDVLYDAQKGKTDESGNLNFGQHVNNDSTECLIYAKPNKLVATIGLNDLVIVDTDDVLLIAPKSKAQEVKKIVEKLKNKNLNNYL